ncbi:MAG: acetate--CoA ligase family protein, partial [Thermohalobaculum sp.]|nr:acetate--CoA ligase family protein [Thermohalobaculum sp.]
GRRLGLVTISGGAGVLMADAAEDAGLDVAPMPADAQAEIKAVVPFASALNPVDVTAQFFNDLSLVPRFTKAMLERGRYDGLIGFWTSVAGSPILAAPLLKSLTEAMKGREDQIFLQSVIAPDEIRRAYEDAGFPCFEDPTRAVNAMAALMAFGAAFAKGRAAVPAVPALPPLPASPLGEREAKEILAAAGLPMVPDRLATTAVEAEDAARAFGRSAFKIASPDIPHKTEAGGVRLGVTAADAAAAFDAIMAAARAHAPTARLDGVLVSPMVEGGVEMILGARIDPVFGPVVMAGLGGVFTEVFRDVSFRRAPISTDTALEMLDEFKGAALLKGARGQPPADARSLAQVLSRLSIFAAAHATTLESVEMNPVRALPDGAVALDALIVTRRDPAS